MISYENNGLYLGEKITGTRRIHIDMMEFHIFISFCIILLIFNNFLMIFNDF